MPRDLESTNIEAAATHPCDRCDGTGTVVRRGSMWWQAQQSRCAYCGGTGRVYAEQEEAQDG